MMMKNLKVLLVLIVLITIGILSVTFFSPDNSQDNDHDESNKATPDREMTRNESQTLPDYDQRKKQVIALIEMPQELEDNFNADDVLEQSEQALKVMIDDYNQALDNPEERKEIERQVKKSGEQYKKALLVKLKKGDI